MDILVDVGIESVLRTSRLTAGLTQSEVAARAGTSQATVAAYEAGRKSPRLETVGRLAEAVRCELVLEFRSANGSDRRERDSSEMSREERRSLWLHRAVAVRIQVDPQTALSLAQRNLEVVRESDTYGHSEPWCREWEALLAGPLDGVLATLTSTSRRASQLRQTAPFAGLLPQRERWALYRTFESSREARTA